LEHKEASVEKEKSKKHAMELKNKVVPNLNGQRHCFLAGTPTDDPQICIYLLNTMDGQANYSLWNVEFLEDEEGNIELSPYEGADRNKLLKQLLETFLETAYDD